MIDNVKIIKFLANGTMGSVYLCSYKGKKYVLKIQQVAKSLLNMPYNNEIWREIDLYRYIDKMDIKDQSFFNHMYEYKVYNSHVQIGTNIGDNREIWEQNVRSIDTSSWRVKYLLEYKGNVTLYNFLLENKNMNASRVYSLCLQIIYNHIIAQRGVFA